MREKLYIQDTMIYADYNATAPLRPEARAAMLAAYELGPVNPSSVHKAGRAARAVVEKARAEVGAAIGSRAEDIVFTSGGTESLALAIQGAVATGAYPIIGVDVMDSKLELAREFGATHTINAKTKDVVARVREKALAAGAQ